MGGTGLGVWEVLRDFCQDGDLEALRQTFPDLSSAQLTAALMYYRRYPEDPAPGRGERAADVGGDRKRVSGLGPRPLPGNL